MTPAAPVSSTTTDDRFEAAVAVFTGLVERGDEPGGSFTVVRHGEVVASAWGGNLAAEHDEPWRADTLVQVFSAGKPLVAVAALLAVAEGYLTLDDPVARWWPDYRDHPQRPTTLRHVLSHTSGKHFFPATAASIPLTDTAELCTALAAMPPATTPGSVLVEQAATYGHLVDGLLAAAGAAPVAALTDRIASRLGLDLHFGCSPADQTRLATLETIDPVWLTRVLDHEVSRRGLTVPAGLLDLEVLSSPAWRAASFPAVGLASDSHSLAAFYDDLHRSDGEIAGLLGPELHRELLAPSAIGHDLFVRRDVEWSLGLRVEDGEIGMGGIGGSSAWYAASLDYSLAYVTRGLADHSRADAVAEAVEAALAR